MIRFYFYLTLFFQEINFVALGSFLKAHRSIFFLVASWVFWTIWNMMPYRILITITTSAWPVRKRKLTFLSNDFESRNTILKVSKRFQIQILILRNELNFVHTFLFICFLFIILLRNEFCFSDKIIIVRGN